MITLVSPRGVSAILLTTIEVGPGAEYPPLASPLLPPSSHLLLSGRPARRIQSDSDPKWSSACCSSAGCCHRTVQSDLPYPSLLKTTRAPSGRPPLTFSRSSLGLLAGWVSLFFFLILDVALLHKQLPHTFAIDKLPWWIKKVWFPSSAPPSLFFWRASGLLLEGTTLSSPSSISSMCCSFLPSSSWANTACTGDGFRDAYSLGVTDCVFGFPPFGHLIYNGLAGPRYFAGEEHLRGFWVFCSLHALSFVSLGFTKSWVGQVALRSPINRHALDLTVSLDDQGH